MSRQRPKASELKVLVEVFAEWLANPLSGERIKDGINAAISDYEKSRTERRFPVGKPTPIQDEPFLFPRLHPRAAEQVDGVQQAASEVISPTETTSTAQLPPQQPDYFAVAGKMLGEAVAATAEVVANALKISGNRATIFYSEMMDRTLSDRVHEFREHFGEITAENARMAYVDITDMQTVADGWEVDGHTAGGGRCSFKTLVAHFVYLQFVEAQRAVPSVVKASVPIATQEPVTAKRNRRSKEAPQANVVTDVLSVQEEVQEEGFDCVGLNEVPLEAVGVDIALAWYHENPMRSTQNAAKEFHGALVGTPQVGKIMHDLREYLAEKRKQTVMVVAPGK